MESKKFIIYFGSLLLGLLIIVSIIGFVSSKKAPSATDTEIPREPLASYLRPNGFYTDAQNNISFKPIPSWKLVATSSIVLPKDLTGLKYAFQKENTTCTLVYANPTLKTYQDKYDQTSFAERVFNTKQQFDSSYYLHVSDFPDNFKFQWEGRQPFPKEIRVISYPNFYSLTPGIASLFILYDTSGSAVSEQCDKDFSKMVTTLVPKFEQGTMTATSSGELHIGDQFLNEPSLYFRDAKDSISRKIMPFDIHVGLDPLLHKNKLYFIENNVLQTLSIPSMQTEDVHGIVLENDEVINQYYIYGNHLFYLAGVSCVEYLDRCNGKLYDHDLSTHTTKLIIPSGITSRQIAGYDETTNSLYAYYQDGDAGCYWASAEIYNLDQAKLVETDSFSSCEGEPNYDESRERFSAFKAQFADHIEFGNQITLKDGTVVGLTRHDIGKTIRRALK